MAGRGTFERVAQRYLADVEPYSRWRAQVINALGITKSLRSEYDHLMLKLHDAMKSDREYQQNSPPVSISFPPGAVWVFFRSGIARGDVRPIHDGTDLPFTGGWAISARIQPAGDSQATDWAGTGK
jgi:hypothetical protein